MYLALLEQIKLSPTKLEKKEKEYQQIFESITDMFQVIKLIYDENNNVVN